MPNYRFIELHCKPDGSYAAIAKAPDKKLVRLEAPPPPCRDPERLPELCDGQVPTCERYVAPSEKQAEEGVVPCGCKSYKECANAWVEVEVLKEKPTKTRKERVCLGS